MLLFETKNVSQLGGRGRLDWPVLLRLWNVGAFFHKRMHRHIINGEISSRENWLNWLHLESVFWMTCSRMVMLKADTASDDGSKTASAFRRSPFEASFSVLIHEILQICYFFDFVWNQGSKHAWADLKTNAFGVFRKKDMKHKTSGRYIRCGYVCLHV